MILPLSYAVLLFAVVALFVGVNCFIESSIDAANLGAEAPQSRERGRDARSWFIAAAFLATAGIMGIVGGAL